MDIIASILFMTLHLFLAIIGFKNMYDLGPNLTPSAMGMLCIFVIIVNLFATMYWLIQVIKESIKSY